MDQLVQCPVCTLYLHSGISLEAHLDTHPKDQVIRALCNLSNNKLSSQYDCRSVSGCDCKSERSYRSRSRTPVVDNHRTKLTTPINHSSSCDKAKDRLSRPGSVISRSHTPLDSFRNNVSTQNVLNLPPGGKLFGATNPERIVSTPIFIDESQDFVNDCNLPETESVEFANKLIVVTGDPFPSGNNIHKYSDSASNLRNSSNYTILDATPELFQWKYPLASKQQNTKFEETVDETKSANISLPYCNIVSNDFVTIKQSSTSLSVPSINQVYGNSANNLIFSSSPSGNSSNHRVKTNVVPLHTKPQFTFSHTSNHQMTNLISQNTQLVFKEFVNDNQQMTVDSGNKEQSGMTSQSMPPNQNALTFNSYTDGSATYVYPQHNFTTNTNSSQFLLSGNSNETSHPNNSYSNYRFQSKSTNLNSFEKPYALELNSTPNHLDKGHYEEVKIDNTVAMGSISFVSDKLNIAREKCGADEFRKKGLKILSNVKLEVQHIPNSNMEIVDLTSTAEVKMNQNETERVDEDSSQDLFVSLDASNKESFHNFSDANSDADSDVDVDTGKADSIADNEAKSSTQVNTFSVIKNIGNPNVIKDCNSQKSCTCPETECYQSIPDLTCKEKTITISPYSELSNGSNGDYSDPQANATLKTLCKFTPLAVNAIDRLNKGTILSKTPKKIQIKSSKYAADMLKRSKCIKAIKNDNRKALIENNVCIKGNSYPIPGPSKANDRIEMFRFLDGNNGEAKIIRTENLSSPVKECRSFANISKPNRENFINTSKSIDAYDTPSNLVKSNFGDINMQTINLSSNSTQSSCTDDNEKQFIELNPVRPVKVIAFGNLSSGKDTFNLLETSQKLMGIKDTNQMFGSDGYFESSYEYFSNEHGVTSNNISALENTRQNTDCIAKEYLEKEPHKTEFMSSSFTTIDYDSSLICGNANVSHSAYDAVGTSDHAQLLLRGDEDQKEEHKIELLTNEKSNDEHEVALNICTDERMPPRGELSGQESNGDMDTPWEGIYQGVTGTTYDLLATETWTSDVSDSELPIIACHDKEDNDSEEMPIVISIKSPDKNYKCATCGEAFECPKERRVHRAKEHPTTSTGNATKTKIRRKVRRLTKTPAAVKSEKPIESEGILALNVLATKDALGDTVLLDVKFSDGLPLPDGLESIDRKPKLEIKEEPKRRKNESQCQTCKETFYSEATFREHLKTHPLECLTCGKYFYRRANLHLHIKRHLGIKQFRCTICEKRFHTRQKLSEHLNIHSGVNPIKCSHCDETFRRYSNMIQHRNRHHFKVPRKIKDFVCHCGEVFHSKKKLLWHKEIHDDRPKNCHWCPEKFVHMSSLTRHIRKAHNNYFLPDEKRKKDNVECAICKQVYMKNTIEVHLRTHSDKRPYSCVICNRSFKVKWNLQLHRWTHANRSSKPFKCNLCKGAFLRYTEYVSHMNSHKAIKPYTCNYCGCRFIRKYNCKRHVQEHENEKKYVCDVPDCGKSFHRSYYLADHMKVHSGSRPFSCNICGKTSSTKSNHNKHLKIHHAREPVATEA